MRQQNLNALLNSLRDCRDFVRLAYNRVLKPVCSPILKILLFVLWRVFSFCFKIISFGRVDLAKADLSSSAPRHIWGLLWPYLISTRPWPIGMPASFNVPRWHYSGWHRTNLKSWVWTPLAVAVLYLATRSLAPEFFIQVQTWLLPAETNVSLWTYLFGLPVLSAVAFIVALHAGLKQLFSRLHARIPVIRRGSKSIAIPYGGQTLFTLPVFMQAWLFIGLIGFGCWLVNAIGVQANGLNGALMTALQKKDAAKFIAVLWQFGTIMAEMTILGPVYAWIKELLILGWTRYCTAVMLDEYIDGESQGYYEISARKSPDNPNERIQNDVPMMCRLVMIFLFALLDAVITLYMFGQILWLIESTLPFTVPVAGYTVEIGHMMLAALLLYALFGTNGATVVGRRLIGQNAEQRKRDAHFRVLMVMFEKYAEPIAAYHGEKREYDQLWRRFIYSMANNYVIVRWRMMLSMFTGAYGKVAQFLPLLTLATFYFSGKIELGAISQSTGACAEILGALSLIVSQFDSISQMLAFGNRVGELRMELARIRADRKADRPRIQRREVEGTLLKVTDMDLYTPGGGKLLIHKLNLEMTPGESVLIRGESGSGKTSALRAFQGVGFWDYGSGLIEMAPRARTIMLTQLAYMLAEGNLREQLLYPAATAVSDDELMVTLKEVNLSTIIERLIEELKLTMPNWHSLSQKEQNRLVLDATPNWDTLSGGEKQRVVVARALVNKVELVLADEATSGLDIANEELLYRAMNEHKIAKVSVGHRPSLVQFHDTVVELLNDGHGGWRIMPAAESVW